MTPSAWILAAATTICPAQATAAGASTAAPPTQPGATASQRGGEATLKAGGSGDAAPREATQIEAPEVRPGRAETPAQRGARLRRAVQAALGANAPHGAMQGALDEIRATRGDAELAAIVAALEGRGSARNLVEEEPRVAAALFEALAQGGSPGEVRLVEFAVTAEDPVATLAADALPARLAPAAEACLDRFLGGSRELHVNRAASLASARASAALIPSLISAQYQPPRKPKGDEAWIAIGKSTAYVANQIPVTGDASGAYQPVVGTIFEGSLLRIMESVVEIHRTEVHVALSRMVERETGLPAPPYGFDVARWNEWYARDYPALAAKHREELAKAELRQEVKSQRAIDEP